MTENWQKKGLELTDEMMKELRPDQDFDVDKFLELIDELSEVIPENKENDREKD